MRYSINSVAISAPPTSRADAVPRDDDGAKNGSAEDRLIARFFKPLAQHPGALGLTDDAALVAPPPGCDLVFTTDAIVAGVHFFPDDPPGQLARKALRVNLSDLAAKGAKPLGFLLSLALPADISESWLSSFAAGLKDDADAFGCSLLGGDTDRVTGGLSITIAMLGSVPVGTMVKRAGAKPNDRVFVTGTVGDAALGVQLRRGAAWKIPLEAREHLLSRYLVPQPRNALADILRVHASAAMDVSDGLAGDLAKLCRVSQVAAHVMLAKLPLSGAAKAVLDAEPAQMESVLGGGDDYEILCTVPPNKAASFCAAASAHVAVTDIGSIDAGEGVRISGPDGTPIVLKRASYSHF
jgi:thiamine-monophosphate kinase